jgi:hypothetical protein
MKKSGKKEIEKRRDKGKQNRVTLSGSLVQPKKQFQRRKGGMAV